jgi:lysozyme family protein
MSTFDAAIGIVLQHEGGWVSDPDDAGGETNYGISMRLIQNLGLKPTDLGIPQDAFTPGCLKGMPREAAILLYRDQFWLKNRYEDIVDQSAATKVFDAGVNMGPVNAAKCAQRAVGVDDDGVLGPITLGAINAAVPRTFIAQMAQEMENYYRRICDVRPQNRKFLSNWLHRARWGVLGPGSADAR